MTNDPILVLGGTGKVGRRAATLSWVDEGQKAHLSDGVQRVLGREPRDFTEYVERTIAAGAWAVPPGPRAEQVLAGVNAGQL